MAYPSDRTALGKFGTVQLWRNADGLTSSQLAVQQAADGFKVWRDYDGDDGIEQYMIDLAAANPGILDLETIGTTVQGRDILALRLTNEALGGDKPAVLYMSTIHAREWISTEVNRRLLHYFVDNYGKNADVTNLVNTSELWFLVVANPDGYQYTFDHQRLWRKNLHDNDGDGQITGNDGVDLNRNYDVDWGYDNEGSSTQFSADDYRGTGPASEPETQAHQALIDRLKFKFLITYHSYGPLILYPFGWQVQTPSADDPLFVAYSGIDATPAISGFDPGVGADLYITNGTTDDYSYAKTGALSWTVELNEGCDGCGFVFPDDESLVQGEYEKNLPFALDLAKSAANPGNRSRTWATRSSPSTSTWARTGRPRDGPDPEKTNNPSVDFTFSVSYGDPQPVRVLAKRDLNGDGTDAVTLNYQITRNGVAQAVQTAPTSQWNGGERGRVGDFYYHVMQGIVTGTQPGDSVKVWFTGAGQTSDSFTYAAKVESSNRVLVLAAEDYTGTSFPVYKSNPRPAYLSVVYHDAVANARHRRPTTYDVDAPRGPEPARRALPLQGRDLVHGRRCHHPRSRVCAGHRVPPRQRRAARVREYLNEGGRLLYTGKYAGLEYAQGSSSTPRRTRRLRPRTARRDGCQGLSDDFLQYYLGAYIYNEDAGTTAKGRCTTSRAWTIHSTARPPGRSFGSPSRPRGPPTSFITTSGILKAQFPQFDSWQPRSGRPPRRGLRPAHGHPVPVLDIAPTSLQAPDWTIGVPAGGATSVVLHLARHRARLGLRVRRGPHRRAGRLDDAPALDENARHHEQQHGRVLPGRLGRAASVIVNTYEGADCSGANWNAASGRSPGWRQWNVDLRLRTPEQVEVSISYASDWSSQGLGVGSTTSTLRGRGRQRLRGRPRHLGHRRSDGRGERRQRARLDSTGDVGFVEGAATSMNRPARTSGRSIWASVRERQRPGRP